MSPELTDSAIAVGGSGGPRGDVDVLVSFLAGRSHAHGVGDPDEPRITVQCRKAPKRRKGAGPALSVRWGFSEALETLQAEGKLPPEFPQLRMAHAHAVGWLYCLAREPSVRVEREAVGLALDALLRLVGLPGLSVYVVGNAGTTMHIRQAAPVLDQLGQGLSRWADGPAPVWLVQLAEASLIALGWHEPFE